MALASRRTQRWRVGPFLCSLLPLLFLLVLAPRGSGAVRMQGGSSSKTGPIRASHDGSRVFRGVKTVAATPPVVATVATAATSSIGAVGNKSVEVAGVAKGNATQ